MSNNKYITYDELKKEVAKYEPILKKIVSVLLGEHVSNPIPAQKEGLWTHHSKEGGLLEHSMEISSILETLVNGDKNLSLLFLAVSLAHDMGKLYGDTTHTHQKTSLEKFEEMLKELDGKMREEHGELWDEFLESELLKVMKIAIRWHHMNFEDFNAFVKQGEGVIERRYFPIVLLMASADSLSIADSWLRGQL